MKKINILIILIVCFFSLSFSSLITKDVSAATNPLIVFTALETNNDEIEVTVDLKSNCGIFAMNVELVYDHLAFELLSYKKGEALSSLDLITTGNDDFTADHFFFNYFSSNENMDASTGRLLDLKFKVKTSALKGDYSIGFSYKKMVT